MEGSSSIQMRMQGRAGYALIDILLGLASSALQSAGKAFDAAVTAQRRARTRRELEQLSDHFLRDIGIDRGDIDRMFR